ncbi:hypothetical protein [uncultured Vibrio sp.]
MQHNSSHTYEYAILNSAAMQHDFMTDSDIITY